MSSTKVWITYWGEMFKNLSKLLLALTVAVTASIIPNQVASATSLSSNGFVVSWDSNKLIAPGSGCNTYFFSYRNDAGFELLEASISVVDSNGQEVDDASLVGVPAGATGRFEIFTCDLTEGPGSYTLVLFLEDYNSNSVTEEITIVFKKPSSQVPGLRAVSAKYNATIYWKYDYTVEKYQVRLNLPGSTTKFGKWYSGDWAKFSWTGLKSKTNYICQVRKVTAEGYGSLTTVKFTTK